MNENGLTATGNSNLTGPYDGGSPRRETNYLHCAECRFIGPRGFSPRRPVPPLPTPTREVGRRSLTGSGVLRGRGRKLLAYWFWEGSSSTWCFRSRSRATSRG